MKSKPGVTVCCGLRGQITMCTQLALHVVLHDTYLFPAACPSESLDSPIEHNPLRETRLLGESCFPSSLSQTAMVGYQTGHNAPEKISLVWFQTGPKFSLPTQCIALCGGLTLPRGQVPTRAAVSLPLSHLTYHSLYHT